MQMSHESPPRLSPDIQNSCDPGLPPRVGFIASFGRRFQPNHKAAIIASGYNGIRTLLLDGVVGLGFQCIPSGGDKPI